MNWATLHLRCLGLSGCPHVVIFSIYSTKFAPSSFVKIPWGPLFLNKLFHSRWFLKLVLGVGKKLLICFTNAPCFTASIAFLKVSVVQWPSFLLDLFWLMMELTFASKFVTSRRRAQLSSTLSLPTLYLLDCPWWICPCKFSTSQLKAWPCYHNPSRA